MLHLYSAHLKLKVMKSGRRRGETLLVEGLLVLNLWWCVCLNNVCVPGGKICVSCPAASTVWTCLPTRTWNSCVRNFFSPSRRLRASGRSEQASGQRRGHGLHSSCPLTEDGDYTNDRARQIHRFPPWTQHFTLRHSITLIKTSSVYLCSTFYKTSFKEELKPAYSWHKNSEA